MSSQPIIPPIVETKTTTYTTYTVQLQDMVLNTSATFIVAMYAGEELIEYRTLVMEGEAYQLWNTDSYVYKWVDAQLHKENPR
jgi:hypothetical protein